MQRTTKARDNQKQLRKAVIDTALAMSRSGLSPGRSGNVSCRHEGGILITPTGMAYDEIEPEDIAFVAADGSVPEGQRQPSSEWRFHLAADRDPSHSRSRVPTPPRAARVRRRDGV